MKKVYLFATFMCLSLLTYSQLRMAVLGGAHSASVKEENSLPGWETQIKPKYSSRSGLNLGITADIPLSAYSDRWHLSPGIFYVSKGRKFYMKNDTLTSILTDTISSSSNIAINYIDIPFNLTYKLPLGKKAKLLLSAGPYIGLFYNGKQKTDTRIYSSNSFKSDEINLETGDEEGKMKTVNMGWNARAGFEIGNVLITSFMSESLTSFYTAPYDGSFKHQVRGVSVGFYLNKAKAPAVRVIKEKDTDADGIIDKIDRCITLPGTAATGGCPDGDNDGIADNDDKCPGLAGLPKYNGCPIPDSDNDGINDEADLCPLQAGIADLNGCPVPDTDNDGLNDRDDKCPTEAGTAENNGCPEIKQEVKKKVDMAAKEIFFMPNSDKLTVDSYESLDAVAEELLQNPSFKLVIEGHTDSTGSDATNLRLSQARAGAVKTYLTSKGVDAQRLEATGFGSSKPLASNQTAEGRMKNRRVELKLKQ